MVTNENEKTITGNVTSELTDGKINRAIKEIQKFIDNDVVMRSCIASVIKPTIRNSIILVIRDSAIFGISSVAIKVLINKQFKKSSLYWIDFSHENFRFYYNII